MTTSELISLAGQLVERGWELSAEDFDATLTAFVDSANDKIAALNAVHVAATSRQAGLKEEAAKWAAAAKTAGNVADRVRARAFDLAVAARDAGEELPGARLQANGGKLPVLFADTFDARTLPEALQVVTVEPNTDALLASLVAGHTYDGVTLGERGEHVRFVATKASK